MASGCNGKGRCSSRACDIVFLVIVSYVREKTRVNSSRVVEVGGMEQIGYQNW